MCFTKKEQLISYTYILKYIKIECKSNTLGSIKSLQLLTREIPSINLQNFTQINSKELYLIRSQFKTCSQINRDYHKNGIQN